MATGKTSRTAPRAKGKETPPGTKGKAAKGSPAPPTKAKGPETARGNKAPASPTKKAQGAAPGKEAGIEKPLIRATAALRKEFEQVRTRLRKLRAQGSEAFDDLYEEVARILESDPPLYLGGGYRTREAFIAAELPGETIRSVNRNMLVALCFSPEDEARHGINFLEEVALYTKELAGAAEAPRAIDLDKLRIPTGEKGKETKKLARNATIDEVRKARRALRKGTGTRRNAPAAEKALRTALGKQEGLSRIAVRATRDTVSLGAIPLGELRALGKVLASVEIAAEE